MKEKAHEGLFRENKQNGINVYHNIYQGWGVRKYIPPWVQGNKRPNTIAYLRRFFFGLIEYAIATASSGVWPSLIRDAIFFRLAVFELLCINGII
jgi:hypothetical protein